MKTKSTVNPKKQNVVVQDLASKKNPKGGIINTSRSNIKHPTSMIPDANSALGAVSTTR